MALIGAAVASPTVATTGPLLVTIAAVEARRRRQRVARRDLAAALPQVIDRLIQQLRSGRSLPQSCRLLDRPEPDRAPSALAPLIEGLACGRPLVEASSDLLAAEDRAVRLLAVTLHTLAINGGPAVPALQRLRHTMIGVIHGRQRTDAESSQALASAGLLVAAPGLFAGVVAAVDGRVAQLYLFEPIGAACVLGAVALSWLGWWWINRILGSVDRRSP